MVEWYFYEVSLFSKTLTRTLFTATVATESDKLSAIFLYFEVSPSACSYCKLLNFNVALFEWIEAAFASYHAGASVIKWLFNGSNVIIV